MNSTSSPGSRSGLPGRLKRPRLYEQLAEHISNFIEAQGLSPGDRLPPERSLAAELGVSRASLAQALVALEIRGRVEIQHGNGAVIREAPTPDAGRSADSGVRLQARTVDELPAAREAIMAGLARAAASNPNAALRVAMLTDDGTARNFAETWRCVRHLAGGGLLADLDDTIAKQADVPESSARLSARLDQLAHRIIDGDQSGAADAVAGILSETA
ncbi:MAG: GntR family transcriptional regulator [Rhodococcus sp. (in: high G+C Gram-positive bacteria)]|nr:GntR family transcriptional regulator [Rhodococcus sp. (in: high G+C Gram-positive bacteria)]